MVGPWFRGRSLLGSVHSCGNGLADAWAVVGQAFLYEGQRFRFFRWTCYNQTGRPSEFLWAKHQFYAFGA